MGEGEGGGERAVKPQLRGTEAFCLFVFVFDVLNIGSVGDSGFANKTR